EVEHSVCVCVSCVCVSLCVCVCVYGSKRVLLCVHALNRPVGSFQIYMWCKECVCTEHVVRIITHTHMHARTQSYSHTQTFSLPLFLFFSLFPPHLPLGLYPSETP